MSKTKLDIFQEIQLNFRNRQTVKDGFPTDSGGRWSEPPNEDVTPRDIFYLHLYRDGIISETELRFHLERDDDGEWYTWKEVEAQRKLEEKETKKRGEKDG